jgi:hypothetical protein
VRRDHGIHALAIEQRADAVALARQLLPQVHAIAAAAAAAATAAADPVDVPVVRFNRKRVRFIVRRVLNN